MKILNGTSRSGWTFEEDDIVGIDKALDPRERQKFAVPVAESRERDLHSPATIVGPPSQLDHLPIHTSTTRPNLFR